MLIYKISTKELDENLRPCKCILFETWLPDDIQSDLIWDYQMVLFGVKFFRYLIHYAQNFKSYLIFIKVNYFDILYHVEILTGLAQAC